ncbi:MAG: aminopeptidase [Spirochaetes bacterium]|nr:aminopeptidase [Spirochaetota bacterium]
MDRNFLEKYANVLLTAVNIQKGQNLLVRGEPVHAGFASIIAAEAYKRGARYVRFDNNEIENPALYRARIEHSDPGFLEYVPQFRLDFLKTLVEENWALIAIRTPEDPGSLAALDQERNAVVGRAIAEASRPWQRRVNNNEIAWLVAFAPTEKLAGKIMEKTAGPDAVEELWKVLIPILRLDREDPAAFWAEHGKRLARRAESITALKLAKIRFRGPGTDFVIGLSDRALWHGGPSLTPRGIEFEPNIPTEEVYTSPDCRVAEGRVAFTRPVFVPSVGKIIEDGWLEFRNGEVADYGAAAGKDVLDTYFALDPNAKRLGEVALVDVDSPIFKSNRVFYNILFDENASCHIALGSAYPGCLRGGESMGEDELRSIGANFANVHTDFMIGSPEVEVSGVTRDGEIIPIIRNGIFTL